MKKQKPLHKKHWDDELETPFEKKQARKEERRLAKKELRNKK